jgi:hypothetical protein
MKLSDRAYTFFKWFCIICLPAVGWWIGEVGADIGIQNVAKVVKFIDATGTLLGIIVGVSDFNFKRENIVYTEPKNGDTE